MRSTERRHHVRVVTEISNCQVEGCGSGADAELNKGEEYPLARWNYANA
jgi:hypothetical protein